MKLYTLLCVAWCFLSTVHLARFGSVMKDLGLENAIKAEVTTMVEERFREGEPIQLTRETEETTTKALGGGFKPVSSQLWERFREGEPTQLDHDTEETTKPLGGGFKPVSSQLGERFREGEPIQLDHETEETTKALGNFQCDDGYSRGAWVKQPAPLPFTAAAATCRSQQGMKLACPLDDNKFLSWLQKQDLLDFVWFNGKQAAPGGTQSNYIKWASGRGRDISRFVSRTDGGTNMWNPTHPQYGEDNALCVKGRGLLSTETCSTPLFFYCSLP